MSSSLASSKWCFWRFFKNIFWRDDSFLQDSENVFNFFVKGRYLSQASGVIFAVNPILASQLRDHSKVLMGLPRAHHAAVKIYYPLQCGCLGGGPTWRRHRAAAGALVDTWKTEILWILFCFSPCVCFLIHPSLHQPALLHRLMWWVKNCPHALPNMNMTGSTTWKVQPCPRTQLSLLVPDAFSRLSLSCGYPQCGGYITKCCWDHSAGGVEGLLRAVILIWAALSKKKCWF